jgi:hypothetical protein
MTCHHFIEGILDGLTPHAIAGKTAIILWEKDNLVASWEVENVTNVTNKNTERLKFFKSKSKEILIIKFYNLVLMKCLLICNYSCLFNFMSYIFASNCYVSA